MIAQFNQNLEIVKIYIYWLTDQRNNIEYNGVDGRVYSNHEYVYEIPLINCRLPNGRSFKLEPTDYRAYKVRGKTNQDLIEECNRDVDKICELPVDIKTKLTMSVEVDKMLYLNFIRNIFYYQKLIYY